MPMSELNLHRPWPLPNRPWMMKQTWNDLLFAHWPIPLETLRPLIPLSLPIDTFDGMAWIAVVPFWMSGVRPRGIPPIPYFSKFAEINLRTYVTIGGKPGVYFFSLDANRRLAVEAARLGFHLPYFRADIQLLQSKEGIVHYHSLRTDSRALPGEFRASYQASSDVFQSVPGTIEHWLTERYCLYSLDRKGHIYRGEINHMQWPLQLAKADIQMNTLTSSFGIQLPNCNPILHFAKKLDVQIWNIKTCKNEGDKG
jgi:uncharacterized protein YqjF (DUF2071 family)